MITDVDNSQPSPLYSATDNTVVIVFAYNRPDHLEKTLNSLESNDCASSLPLRVYIDSPKSKSDQEMSQEVYKIASRSRRFKSVSIIKRPTNLGLYASVTLGVSESLAEYESAIIFEDDMVTSPNCLSYFLEALNIYRLDKQVASIHAWVPRTSVPLPATFFMRGAECWGWATWRESWKLFRHDAMNMADEIQRQGLVHEFNLRGGYNYYRMLQDRANYKNASWAICWRASIFLENCLTLHPSDSLVSNIGLDMSGIHSGYSRSLEVSLSSVKIDVKRLPLCEDSYAYEAISNYFKSTSSLYFLAKEKLANAYRRILKTRVG